MAWLRRHYDASLAELDETADRLRTEMALIEDHADPHDHDWREVYRELEGWLEDNRTARGTLQEAWGAHNGTTKERMRTP